MKDYKYCTFGLTSNTYKVLTCPMEGCPDTRGLFYEHKEMNDLQIHYKDWNTFEDAYHCKMVFTASGFLNGKLVVKIDGIEDAEAHVFAMPRHWNKEYPFHGIFENNDFFTYQKSGTYEFPSDWVIMIQYYIGYFDGDLRVSSEVLEYDENDIPKLENDW